MNNLDLYMIMVLLVLVALLVYSMFKGRQTGTKISVPYTRGRPVVYNQEHLGGLTELIEVERLTEDKSIFKFANGVNLQARHSDFSPGDVIQVLVGKERPLWILHNANTTIQPKYYADQLEREKQSERKADYEHALAKYYEQRLQTEVDRRVTDLTKIEQAKKPEMQPWQKKN